ncbi:hypothetical protein YC2023_077156 [Brassica napus]
MNLVNPRLPSCFSRRDESVATKNASIGVRTKPHAPPEVSPLRAREVHAPLPDHRPPPPEYPPSPPLTIAGNSPVTRSTRPSQLSESTRLTRLTDRLAGLN